MGEELGEGVYFYACEGRGEGNCGFGNHWDWECLCFVGM